MRSVVIAFNSLKYNRISRQSPKLFQNIFNDIILQHKKADFLLLFHYNRVNKIRNFLF